MIRLTRTQARQADRVAIETYGIAGLVLMENAGIRAAEHIHRLLTPNGRVAVICGGGNNGGDGYVIGRQLANQGIEVTIYAQKRMDQLTGDAQVNGQICQKMKLPIKRLDRLEDLAPAADDWRQADVLVDALLGTGFQGILRPELAAVIDGINQVRAETETRRVVAVDVPSGLDVDTGQPAQATVRADLTVTFVAEKTGFTTPEAAKYLGRVEVASIGIAGEWLIREDASGVS